MVNYGFASMGRELQLAVVRGLRGGLACGAATAVDRVGAGRDRPRLRQQPVVGKPLPMESTPGRTQKGSGILSDMKPGTLAVDPNVVTNAKTKYQMVCTVSVGFIHQPVKISICGTLVSDFDQVTAVA